MQTDNRKPPILGNLSLGVSVLCPVLFFGAIHAINDSTDLDNIFKGIILYPIIPIILSSIALYRKEKKTQAILGIFLSIIGTLGLILYIVILAFKGLNSVW